MIEVGRPACLHSGQVLARCLSYLFPCGFILGVRDLVLCAAALKTFVSSDVCSSFIKELSAWEISGFMEAKVCARSSVPCHCFTRRGSPTLISRSHVTTTIFLKNGLIFPSVSFQKVVLYERHNSLIQILRALVRL